MYFFNSLILMIGIWASIDASASSSLKCISYGDSENGVEISITNGVGTFIERVIGGRIPTNLGPAKILNRAESEVAYAFPQSAQNVNIRGLKVWPNESASMTVQWPQSHTFVGFKGQAEVSYNSDSSLETIGFICN